MGFSTSCHCREPGICRAQSCNKQRWRSKVWISLLCAISFEVSLAADVGMTNIDEGQFRVQLNGRWTKTHGSDDGSWAYVDDRGDTVTVSLLYRVPNDVASSLHDDAATYLKARREVEQRVGGKTFALTEVTTRERADVVFMRYSGHDKASERRTSTLAIVNKWLAASFCYEAKAMSETDFATKAKSLFGQVSFGTRRH